MKKIVYILMPFLLVGCSDDDCPVMEGTSTSGCETICLNYDNTQSIQADGSSLVQIFIERAEVADSEFQTGSITIINGTFQDGRTTMNLDLTTNFRDTIRVVAGINPNNPMTLEATLGTSTVLTSEPLLIDLLALSSADIYTNLTGAITDLLADGESERLLELDLEIPVNVRYTAERNILRAFGGTETASITDAPLNGNSSVIISSDQIPGDSFIRLEFLEPSSSDVLYQELVGITTIQALPDRISVSAGNTLSVDSTGAVITISATVSRSSGKTSEGTTIDFFALSDPNDLNSAVGRFLIDQLETGSNETVSSDFVFENNEGLTTNDKIYIVAQTQGETSTITDTWTFSIVKSGE